MGKGISPFFRLAKLVAARTLQLPLPEEFLDLFICARDWQLKVASYVDGNGSQLQWGPIFRRNLTGRGGLAVLSLILSAVLDGEDSRVWTTSKMGLSRWLHFLNKFKGLFLYQLFLWSVENESSPP